MNDKHFNNITGLVTICGRKTKQTKKKLHGAIEYYKTTKFSYNEIKCVYDCDLCMFFLCF